MELLRSRHGKPHRYGVYVWIAVTCHLQFWKNDRDLLRATALARGWIRYRNMSQHRKLNLEKKIVQLFFRNVAPVFDVMVPSRNSSPCLCAAHMPLLSVPQPVTRQRSEGAVMC